MCDDGARAKVGGWSGTWAGLGGQVYLQEIVVFWIFESGIYLYFEIMFFFILKISCVFNLATLHSTHILSFSSVLHGGI